MGVVSGGGGGGSMPVLVATTPLSSADLLALDTTPVTLVPAVVDKVIVPVLFFSIFTPATTPYSAIGEWRVFNGPTFGGSGFGSTVIVMVKLTATVATQSVQLSPYQDGGEPSTLNTGQPLRIDLSAAVTDGDGTVTIVTLYTLVSGA